MEEHRRYGLVNQIDMEQILSEAQNRWLRPAEICEILRNYRKFRIAPEPPDKPPSGSLFLFDRKVLRYFRKDGHNWRKKKDGKTVREAHERLKVGSIDMLHCYYAHGEENENFQRRSYWMLEEDFMHIVLVHYREVKGNNMRFGCVRDAERVISSSQMDSPESSSFLPSHDQASSLTTDTTSLNSVHTSEYEDAESVNHQASSSYPSFLEVQQREGRTLMNKTDAGLFDSYYPVPYPNDYQGKQLPSPELNFLSLLQENTSKDNTDAGFGFTSGSGKQLDLTSWEEVLERCTTGFQVSSFPPSIPFTPSPTIETIPKRENILEQLFFDELNVKQEVVGHMQNQEMLQHNGYPVQNGYQIQLLDAEQDCILKPNSEQDLGLEGNFNYSSNVKPPLLDCSKTEDLKKLDSFNRWMSKELGEVEESHMHSSSRFYWNSVDTEDVGDESSMSSHVHLDPYLLSPSLSQDQLFSIIDFSPTWAYTDSETKVLVTGIFLKNQQDAAKCKWSCMFGEIEVLAEVLADGVLCCQAPPHTSGRVPFYVTCSNRLACSEVREFEYRVSHDQDMDNKDPCIGNTVDMLLHIRLEKLLSLGYVYQSPSSNANEKSHISSKINSLMKEEDEWLQVVKFTSEEEFSPGKVKEQLLKEKLHVWLSHKITEDGKGPSVLDNKGQGVLHLAAALGYDWAIEPTVTAGVSINFRDVNGWTALHWAAFCGRERTVVALVHLGAAPGALTDPTPKSPSGRAPADLASFNGHKGIAGYLAESSLTSHLSSLALKDKKDIDGPALHEGNAVQTVTERSAIPYTSGDAPDELSLKDSLTAVRNASQAAARIHQVFRVQSFQKKQLIEYGDDKFGMSDERALSLISVKTHRPGLHNEPMHAAAIRIQNKFRGWKGRKEFLIIRQRIVKIQAHVRGHQVRKHYRKFTWSVGIVEKAILRWRRKGSGLRGFRVDAMIEGSTSKSDDDYDFLKEGKKQTEERLQKALARVKSMVQYPEARDQYRRLLNVVSELKESEVLNGGVPEETGYVDDDLIDLEALLDDDTFMSTAF